MGEIMATIVAGMLEALLEIDEMQTEVLPDGSLQVVFVTTGFKPELAEIKTKIWALLGIPAQVVKEVRVEELQAGPIFKRYKITAILEPLFGKSENAGKVVLEKRYY